MASIELKKINKINKKTEIEKKQKKKSEKICLKRKKKKKRWYEEYYAYFKCHGFDDFVSRWIFLSFFFFFLSFFQTVYFLPSDKREIDFYRETNERKMFVVVVFFIFFFSTFAVVQVGGKSRIKTIYIYCYNAIDSERLSLANLITDRGRILNFSKM